MGTTNISWADYVWNPIAGCTKCSPGCLNCYAERMAKRQVAMGCARGGDNKATWIAYSDAINPKTGKWSGKIALRPDQLDKPLHWRKPKRIFVCSMSDLFHPKVPSNFQIKVFDITQQCPQHTFLILTKRPKNMSLFFGGTSGAGLNQKPLKKVHLGVSISTQAEADEKIPILLQIPAAVRWLSIEPMLGPVDLDRCMKLLNWVVVGGESGPKRRPCKLAWIESVIVQCIEAKVPVFVKQINVNGKVVKMPKEYPQEYPERS